MSVGKPTVVNGRVMRTRPFLPRSLSPRKCLLAVVVLVVLILTNPANKVAQRVGFVKNKRSSRNITNYGIFSLKKTDSDVVLRGLKSSVSCPFSDPEIGPFCVSIGKHLAHGKPLLWDKKDHAYTAHRSICFLIIAFAFLSFCCNDNNIADQNHPAFFRAMTLSFCRQDGGSAMSLLMDLFNACMFVYPALVVMAKLVATQQQPQFGKQLGLPNYVDFFLTVIAHVFVVGGGCNLLATYITGVPCTGFDSTVAASITYYSIAEKYWSTPPMSELIAPPTLFWCYLPFSVFLGGKVSFLVSWLLAGTAGAVLGEYHMENRDLWHTVRHLFTNGW